MKKYYPVYDDEMEDTSCVIIADEKPDKTAISELYEEYKNDNAIRMQNRDELWKLWLEAHREDVAKRLDYPEITDKDLERCIKFICKCKFDEKHPFEYVTFGEKIKEAGFDVILFLDDDCISVGTDVDLAEL